MTARCGCFNHPHPAGECPLRVEGILRVGDIIEEWPGCGYELLTALPRSPLGRPDPTYPWPCITFPTAEGAEPFGYDVPADFAEQAARAGRFLPADPWSTWTDPPTIWDPTPPATEDATP